MELDWVQYWFMFPVAIGVATTAMLSGIGGVALFIPIFIIVFPLLGPEYPLTTAAAIGTALLTGFFGFASGFVGYYRKGLIDFRSAAPFFTVAIPVAIIGALFLATLKDQEVLLKAAYAVLMLVMCPVVLRHTPPQEAGRGQNAGAAMAETRPLLTMTGRDGRIYEYRKPRLGTLGAVTTAIGAFLTGLLGVGIGEVIMPQLIKRNRMPVAVAVGTSVFIVIVTIAAASFTQVASLIAAGGVDAVPWNLVCYTVPGVIIGGQIGPRLQGAVSARAMERGIAALFGIIGGTMGFIVLRQLGAF